MPIVLNSLARVVDASARHTYKASEVMLAHKFDLESTCRGKCFIPYTGAARCIARQPASAAPPRLGVRVAHAHGHSGQRALETRRLTAARLLYAGCLTL
jgi:hypothetical protein